MQRSEDIKRCCTSLLCFKVFQTASWEGVGGLGVHRCKDDLSRCHLSQHCTTAHQSWHDGILLWQSDMLYWGCSEYAWKWQVFAAMAKWDGQVGAVPNVGMAQTLAVPQDEHMYTRHVQERKTSPLIPRNQRVKSNQSKWPYGCAHSLIQRPQSQSIP